MTSLPLERLQHHVTGAIQRGEAEPIVGIPAKTAPMVYIQRKDRFGLETVDEFATRKEARAMLAEYRMSDPSATFYTSTRACKAWKE